MPWVSADDIAAVAYRALVDKESHNCDHVVLGKELLSYGDVSCCCSPFCLSLTSVSHSDWTSKLTDYSLLPF